MSVDREIDRPEAMDLGSYTYVHQVQVASSGKLVPAGRQAHAVEACTDNYSNALMGRVVCDGCSTGRLRPWPGKAGTAVRLLVWGVC